MKLRMGAGPKFNFPAMCLGIITALLLLSAFNVIHLH
jgi:hypothetical protein